jgi:hypothetical protein
LADIDVKAAVAVGEVVYRNGANLDGISMADLATALVATSVIGTAATLEFSIDGTAASNSDAKLMTEKAVVTYVAANGGGTGNVSTTDTDASTWDFVSNDPTLAGDRSTHLVTEHAAKGAIDALPTVTVSDETIVPIETVDGVTLLNVDNLLSSTNSTFNDGAFVVENTLDDTKKVDLSVSAVATGTTETLTVPQQTGNTGTIVTTTSTDEVTAVKWTSNFAGFGNQNTGARNTLVEIHPNLATGSSNALGFVHNGGTVATPAQSASGALIGSLLFRGRILSGAVTSGSQARLLVVSDDAVTDSTRGAHFRFTTTATGGSSNREVFRIFGTGAFGYPNAAVSGVGGAVTQATSKSTGVTLDKPCGQITMHNASLANVTNASFTLTNNTIEATDTVLVNIASGATASAYNIVVDAVAAGSCRMYLRNISGGPLSEAVVLNFAVIKGANQ